MASLLFIGDCDWKVNSDPKWSSDSYGADRATLVYRGRRDKMADFIAGVGRFFEMPGFPSMNSASYSNSGGTIIFPEITVEFVGFKQGGIPPVEVEDGTSVITAQGGGFDSSSAQTVSGSLTCLSPRTTWSWWEVTLPNRLAPRYFTIRQTFDPRRARLLMTVVADNGEVKYEVPLSSAVAIFNSLVPQPRIEFDVKEVVPGKLWKCTNAVTLDLV